MSDIPAKASNVLQTNGCLKVSSKSSPASVAGAVNQAVKAIAISRGFLSPVGIEIVCVPSFADIVIDGEYRTAIRFSVEPRVPVTSHDIAQSQSSEFE